MKGHHIKNKLNVFVMPYPVKGKVHNVNYSVCQITEALRFPLSQQVLSSMGLG